MRIGPMNEYNTFLGELVVIGLQILVEKGVSRDYLRSLLDLSGEDWLNLHTGKYHLFPKVKIDFLLSRVSLEVSRL